MVIAPTKRVLSNGSATRSALSDCGGGNRDQVKNVAAVQGKFVCLTRFNDLAERRSLNLQQRSLSGYFDCLADLANRQRGDDVAVLLNFDDDRITSEVLEARLLYIQAIRARVHVDELE